MRPASMERKIRELHERVRVAREHLGVLDEQVEALAEEAEDARVRGLVAETPLAGREAAEARRHLDLAERAAAGLREEIRQCEAERDQLLRDLPVATRR